MTETPMTPHEPGHTLGHPVSRAAAADQDDAYGRMLGLAELFDSSAQQMRGRARLGTEVLADDAVADSARLAPATFAAVEGDVLEATIGPHGLLTRAAALDADAVVIRATVQTYRWIDQLQVAAYRTLGSIAGRAIGYLRPGITLGGTIVSAGLIETDALDRDGIAAYLNELAESNPELWHHVSSGGGGLLEALQMRSLLTAGVLSGETGRLAARGGLRAAGIEDFPLDAGSALRDVAGGFVEPVVVDPPVDACDGAAPRSLEELLTALVDAPHGVTVHKIAEGRFIAYLTGPRGAGDRLRLVGGDRSAYADQVVRSIEAAADGHGAARVMLVGSAQGGVTAAEVAAAAPSTAFVIDQVVTAGAPSAHVPRIPDTTRMLSLEDRADPVALLGSLVNATAANRVTVVFDGTEVGGENVYVAGARAADSAIHPELRVEIERLQQLGYLAG